MHRSLYTSIAATILALSSCSLQAKELTTSLNEKIALKKLGDYWEERDTDACEQAIIEFLAEYKESAYRDQLHAMLGDLYFSQKQYPKAVDSYALIEGKKWQDKTSFRYLHSLYEAKHFDELIAAAEPALKDLKADEMDIIRFELAETYYQLGSNESEAAQKELFAQALHHYKHLARSQFEQETLLPLAELHVFFQEYPSAVKIYTQLAKIDEERSEEFLFHAASLQALYDKKAAVRTFDQVFTLKGPLSKKAGYNVLSLLFQMQRYHDVVTASIHIDNHLPEDKLSVSQYYLGKSLFYEKDFEGAAEVLEELLGSSHEFTHQLHTTLLSCAKELHDLSLCDKVTAHLDQKNPLFETAITLHARLSREQKEWTVAREDIQTLLEAYPDHKDKLELSYDLALLLMQEGKYEDASLAFSDFLESYPDSAHQKDAMRNLLYLRSLDVKAGGSEEPFASLLKEMLCTDNLFSRQEQQENHFLLAQTLMRLQKPDLAKQELLELVEKYPEGAFTAQSHLLLSHLTKSNDLHAHTSHLEKALSLSPELNQESKWHRLLFNAYLQLCEEEDSSDFLSKAADHLFQVKDGGISLENARWLASHYLQQPAQKNRAITVLERLTFANGVEPLVSVEVEAEVMRLVSLYKETKAYDKGVSLLKALANEQAKDPNRPWKFARMAKFELGQFYALMGEHERAIDIYQELISSSSHAISYFALAAQLELAKLSTRELSSLDKEQQRSQIAYACDLLKDVEAKRQLVSEPLHIEASLQYIDLKTQLVSPAEQPEKKSLLLAQVQQELNKLDLATKVPSEQRSLIEHYLAYIEIQLSSLKQEIPLAKVKEELNNLMTHVYNEALHDRLEKTLEELDKPL